MTTQSVTAVRFFGQVQPLATTIGVSDTTPIDYFDFERNRHITFRVSVSASSLLVLCKCPGYSGQEDLVFLWIRATDMACALIDTIGFASGRGWTVYIDRYQLDSGDISAIDFSNPPLAQAVTAYNINNFTEILPIIMSKPPLFWALRDLSESLVVPHRAAINAYRAVEAVRHMLSEPGDNASIMWSKLRLSLNVERQYIQFIANNSTEARHGNRVRVGGTEAAESLLRAWTIMNRFIELQKRRADQLPIQYFPLLTG